MRILRELIKNNVMPFPSPALRKSFRTIGRNLHVDQGTVRNRIRKFRQSGLLKEFYLGLNPSLFGLKIGAVFFDVRPQSEKESLKETIASMDGVLLVCDYMGPKLSTVFCYQDQDGMKKFTRQITRMANSEEVISLNKPFLPCDKLELTPVDWRIISSLQHGDPWKKPFGIVAKETGLSTKTVKKRVQSLVEEGAIYLLAMMNLGSFEGFVPADLNVFYKSPEAREKVVDGLKEYLGEMLVFADIEDRLHSYFALAVPSISRIREIESYARNYDGVSGARLEVLHDILSVRRFYDVQTKANVELPKVADTIRQ